MFGLSSSGMAGTRAADFARGSCWSHPAILHPCSKRILKFLREQIEISAMFIFLCVKQQVLSSSPPTRQNAQSMSGFLETPLVKMRREGGREGMQEKRGGWDCSLKAEPA
mmetsp:Transcript_2892/g.9763  ORF Transcript_2892/g.9763 Transcript_2892/m.9763 type:complete len:110 (+) Transcript_2892:854-1183(+)